MKIKIVISGRAYHTMQDVPETLELCGDATLDEALTQIAGHLSDNEQLPATTMIALSGKHVGTATHHESCPLSDGDEIVLIVPVAGG